jgi:hypothetical protein
VLLTGPFGGLTDDIREFLLCLADGGLALARRRTALLRSLCDAGRLTEAEGGLLQLTDLGREFLDLPDPAQLGFVFAAWWEGVDWGDWAPRPELGRLLWHERDALLQELAGLPRRPGRPGRLRPPLPGPGRPPLAVHAGRDRPGRLPPGPLGDRPGPPGHAGRPRRPRPHVPLAGLVRALTGTTPALFAAAAAMSGPEPPVSLAAATADQGPAGDEHGRSPGAGPGQPFRGAVVVGGW